MSEAVAAPVVAASPKAPKAKKAVKPKQPAAHPKYVEMIAAALGSLKERSGSSRQAILKYITSNYKVGDNLTAVNAHLKLALKPGVKSGALKQSKGSGVAGSLKLGEVKKPAKKATKPKAAKPPKKAKTPKKKDAAKKKVATKKPAGDKKAKKSPKKAKAAKPKKVKTPKKTKEAKPKKGKSPKKAKAAAKPKKAKTPKKAAAK